jgi:hypothetical protein
VRGVSENRNIARTLATISLRGVFAVRPRGLWGQFEASCCVTPPQFQLVSEPHTSAPDILSRKIKIPGCRKLWCNFNYDERTALLDILKFAFVLPNFP